MEHKKEKYKRKDEVMIKWLVIIAFIIIFISGVIAFIDLEEFCIKDENDGYVAALFSLSGVIIFYSALRYQIKEYKLQVIELKKSVEAQVKSSEALEEQRKLLLEQNSYSFIFGVIKSFNEFKERNEIYKCIDELVGFYQSLYALRWQKNLNNLRLNKTELNKEFAKEISKFFSDTIYKHHQYELFKQYVQFAYNILYTIDTKIILKNDNFLAFFYSQLNKKEMVMLSLANLDSKNMPHFGNLFWEHITTEGILNLIKKYPHQNIEFDLFDVHILTDEFKKLKQSNPSAF